MQPSPRALVRARAEAGQRLRKAKTRCKYTPVHSAIQAKSSDVQGTLTAHRIVEQVKLHGIADVEFVDGRALLNVGAMKEDVAVVRETDEAVALTDEQSDNPTGGGYSMSLGRDFRL